MVNHFLMTLYNRTDANPEGVYNPLQAPLAVPAVVSDFFRFLRGNTAVGAWEFAKLGTKIVGASTWDAYLWFYDQRTTTDYSALVCPVEDAMAEVNKIASVRGDALHALVESTPIIRHGLKSQLPQERAAAVLVGLVSYITEYNLPPVD